jgi:hypothetical protein
VLTFGIKKRGQRRPAVACNRVLWRSPWPGIGESLGPRLVVLVGAGELSDESGDRQGCIGCIVIRPDKTRVLTHVQADPLAQSKLD